MFQQAAGLVYGRLCLFTGSLFAGVTCGLFAAAAPAFASPQPLQPLLAQTLPAEGIYLFGEQPLPDQLATAYLVFELQAGAVVGAFYMPHSSFDCVQGQLTGNELALTVTDSYSQERYAYALALDTDTLAAGANGSAEVSLEGYHEIDAISDTDRQILETCKAMYQDTL